MSIASKLEQLIDTFMLSVGEAKKPSTRTPEFRISSMPYCPIRRLLFNKPGNDSFSMNFYTSIGTAVHETIQSWATISEEAREKIFSCWKIKETGEVVGPCFYKDIPKKYSNYTIEYEEITIKYRGLSGHVDLVLEILPNKYMLIDFKTTNLTRNKLREPYTWRNKYPASTSSIIQISSYSSLLTKEFGLNIIGWCLIYVDRGDVISHNDSYHKVMKPWNKKKTKKFMKYIDQACDNNKRFIKLNKLLDKSDRYSSKADSLLKEIVKNRPCVDETTYDEFMGKGFYRGPQTAESRKQDLSRGIKNGDCVLKPFCLKSNKSCLNAIHRKL